MHNGAWNRIDTKNDTRITFFGPFSIYIVYIIGILYVLGVYNYVYIYWIERILVSLF